MEKISIILLFFCDSPFVHECSASSRSLFAHFYGFSSKLPDITKFSLKIVIFLKFNFEYFHTFLVQSSDREQRSIFGQFWPICVSAP